MQASDRDPATAAGQVIGGTLLMLLGILLLTGRLGWSGLRFSSTDWPFLVLAFGVIRLVYPADGGRRAGSRRFGAWLLFLGTWGLLNEFGWFDLDYRTSWPLLVVGFGVNVVWRALETGHAERARGEIHGH
jgi:hypothetical protein